MTRIAVILGSARPMSAGAGVVQWVADKANTVEGVQAEVVNIADANLPLFAEAMPPMMATPTDEAGAAWNEKIGSYDALIFVTPEYNHSISGALKNAIDYLAPAALANKAVGFVGYSFAGGIRPVEHLRQILANFDVAAVNAQVSLNLMTDFENMSEFKPADFHDGEVPAMVEAMVARGNALAALRQA